MNLGKYQTELCNNREIPSATLRTAPAIIGIFIIQETINEELCVFHNVYHLKFYYTVLFTVR